MDANNEVCHLKKVIVDLAVLTITVTVFIDSRKRLAKLDPDSEGHSHSIFSVMFTQVSVAILTLLHCSTET